MDCLGTIISNIVVDSFDSITQRFGFIDKLEERDEENLERVLE